MSMDNRPKLSEQMRGKEGSDLFDEIKKEFENDKKYWFHDRPSFSKFKREGFPFESDNFFGTKSDSGMKSHLEDLAKKHPEFSKDLKCSPWGGSIEKDWDKAVTIPVAVEKEGQNSKESDKPYEGTPNRSKDSNSVSALNDNLKQHNLRNTVDMTEQIQKANHESNDLPKRSISAPPDTVPANTPATMNKHEPKRFTSKIEITPVNPYEKQNVDLDPAAQSEKQCSGSSDDTPVPNWSNSAPVMEIPIHTNSDIGSPHMGRPRSLNHTHSLYDSPTMNLKQSHVHHIPIFVEGRDDPVVSKTTGKPVQHSKQVHHEHTVPLEKKVDTNFGHPPTQPSNSQLQEKPQPPQEPESSIENPSQSRLPLKPKTPVERVQEVKEEVENLVTQINQYNGNSRGNKKYLFLDEMLTRNLIKLDTIEVEGNDSLRSARKDVIKQIQAAISLLESKIPVDNSEKNSCDDKVQEKDQTDEYSNSLLQTDDTETKETNYELNAA